MHTPRDPLTSISYMKLRILASLAFTSFLVPGLSAATLTVTTTDSDNPPAGSLSLKQALLQAQDGDTIAFNIAGDGPHYLPTPDGGYPLLRQNNLTIDGYSQPGSSPNSNTILQGNNAKIKIVLDSRNGNSTVMAGPDFPQETERDDTGFGSDESGVLGFHTSKGINIRGLSIIGKYKVGAAADISLYGIALAHGASGHISGCYIGVEPTGQLTLLDDGVTPATLKDGIAGFRYRVRETGLPDRPILIDDMVVGVSKNSTNPRAELNVFSAITTIPVMIEGNQARICGNYLNVYADGKHDFIPTLMDPLPSSGFEGAIEIGRGGNGTVVGVDGDGKNDAEERNVIGGTIPKRINGKGYNHTIEFYGQSPGQGIIIAGNYIGIGVDGLSRFTNSAAMLNADGGSAQYRVGSDLNGVSDGLEGNVVGNNWPAETFPAESFSTIGKDLNFFDSLQAAGTVSLRGNTLINNYPFPVSPLKTPTTFLATYYGRALADASTGVTPSLEVPAAETLNPHLRGSVPAPSADYPNVVIDVYIADDEGRATGQAAGIEALPEGFVQGRRYLGSFQVDGPADLNPSPSEFEFDITRLGGGLLTVTANYSKSPAGDSTLTSPFSNPVFFSVTPLTAEAAGLARIKPDQIIYNDVDTINQDNWEPYTSVLGNSTFLIEANSHTQEADGNQRYVLAFQPAAGGDHGLGDSFFGDDGTPYRSKINNSRQNGNPGRVAGDKRPGASTIVAGGETSAHFFEAFKSNDRWSKGPSHPENARFATIQTYALSPSLVQTPLSLAQDAANGRRTPDTALPAGEESRFGGDVAVLDNGNIVALVDERTKFYTAASQATVAAIFTPTGAVVKESFLVADGQIWSNLAAFKGGFCVRASGTLYFYDNDGNLTGKIANSVSGASFDDGRGDNTRIGSHINSSYVFLAGPSLSKPQTVRLAAFDARSASFVAVVDVNEPGISNADGNIVLGSARVTVACDALNRVAVAYDGKLAADRQSEALVRVFQFSGDSASFSPLTQSFHAFVNSMGNGRKTTLPNVSMTTKQILIAAKGIINSHNNNSEPVDTKDKTTFFTVISHPAPAEDPTLGVISARPVVGIAREGGKIKISFTGNLESTTSLTNPNWQPVAGATSPYTPAGNGAPVYYRSAQ